MRRNEFQPDWASAPGETIVDMLSERGLSVSQFATQMGMTDQSTADLLDGRATISVEIARRLESVVGASFQFWIARDGQYRDDAARQSTKYRDWLNDLPLGDMIKFGWMPPVKPAEEAATCLRYFGVSSLPAWHEKYARVEHMAAFRTSPSFESRPASVAAWLRQGELLAGNISCEQWNPTEFASSLQRIRRLTRQKDLQRTLPELERICAESGVAFVVVRCPSGCRASGATRMLSPQKVLLQLSLRYLSDDQFWFTFFHEAGHALLHGTRAMFVDGIEEQGSPEENEANEFAERTLIPDAHRSEFESLRGEYTQVLRFAQKVGIAPGLVVGQMQHRGKLPQTWLNGLKRRYTQP